MLAISPPGTHNFPPERAVTISSQRLQPLSLILLSQMLQQCCNPLHIPSNTLPTLPLPLL
jgi:hypothetical protein